MKSVGLRVKCPICGCYMYSKTLMKKDTYDVDVKVQLYEPDINDKFKGRMHYYPEDDIGIIAKVRVHLIERLKNALKSLGIIEEDKYRDIDIPRYPMIEKISGGYRDFNVSTVPIVSMRKKDRYVGAKIEVV